MAIGINSPAQIAQMLLRAQSLQREGQLAQAAAAYRSILELDPDHWESLNAVAAIALQGGELERAVQAYGAVIARKSDHAEGYYKRANALNGLGRLEAALADYDQAIAYNPRYAYAFCNRGTVLERLGRFDEALASYDRGLALEPDDFLAHCNRGSALRKLQRFSEALAAFERAVALKSDYAEAHFYIGSVMHGMQRYDAAVASYDRAIEYTPGNLSPFAAYLSRGLALLGSRRLTEALASYDKAIALKTDYAEAYLHRGNVMLELRQYAAAVASYDKATEFNPVCAEAFQGRGLALRNLRRLQEAINSYDRAIALKSGYADAFVNRGHVLLEVGQSQAAVASYDQAIQIEPANTDALQGRAIALLNLGRIEAAVVDCGQVLARNPEQKYLFGVRRHAQMQICDWHNLSADVEHLTAGLRARIPLTTPFPMLALIDSAPLHRIAAELWVREEFPPDGALGAIPPRQRCDKIRVGYFSPDFRNHPVAYLTAELFETHDRSRFEITAFAFGGGAKDAVRARLQRAFDRFVDVSGQSDTEVAMLARELGIDIAVDLGGHTEHCRTRIFALRAAPIQISYIGYLGTMGAPYMDYLVADATIVPAGEQANYSEKILYLPSYQANDSQRRIAERTFTRNELGLPAAGFVFACFNANYKILPGTFELWMRIMKRVDGSVLFLYAGNQVAERNLSLAAQSHGVDAQRIVFGEKLDFEDYLARLRAMDLFLDTLPYNAGTTASDALWVGLPVLTCLGNAFAGRLAASLLMAIDLPELITANAAQYEELAVKLATNPTELARIRQKLAHNRLTTPLFDTRRFARNLESAYAQIYERHLAGLAPDHIYP
jgi:predicted O-linked N-acetylglucosamine transferase (SPINDLY family)